MTFRATNVTCSFAIPAFDPPIIFVMMTATAAAHITRNLIISGSEHVGVVAAAITPYFLPLSWHGCLCCHPSLFPNPDTHDSARDARHIPTRSLAD